MKKNFENNTTLDNKHNEMITSFNKNNTLIIPKYKNEIEKLEILLNNLKDSKRNIEKRELLKSKITDYKNKIYNLEKNEKEYYLNNSKYIFQYFEEKKNIELDNESEQDKSNINNFNINKYNENNKINKFFNINNDISTNILSKNIEINNQSNTKLNSTTSDKYFYNINNKIVNYDKFCFDSDICKFCRRGEMIYVESEGICICNNCSKTMKYLIENEKPSYKEPPKEVCFYAYKRINHLREILAQFQAKESTNIPDEVFENIKNQVKKERIELKDLNNKKTKEILKNLGYNKYYEHIPYIKDKLGIRPPVMSPELEDTLCNLFMEIQKPYSKFCPSDRVNFLNYYYTLYKFCELLNEDKFLPFFPMLKDREKRIEQDQIWKKICEELDWEFIPTI
jgi:hypothetical protein